MKPLLRSCGLLAAAMALLSAAPLEAQILRPEADAGAEILQTERLLRLRLALPVDRETAFDAWTVADHLVQWLPHSVEMQVAVGDGFRMQWDGYEGTWTGTYLEVERPERLVFTWVVPPGVFPSGSYETTVTLTFEEVDEGRTTLVLEHSGFHDAAELESQLQAWRGYLFALRAYLLRPTVD